MKVSSYADTKPIQELPGVVKREVINADDGAPNSCMRVFELEPGSSTPSQSHAWEHEVFILSGTGIVVDQSGDNEVKTGDVVFVPGGEKHQFRNPGDEPWEFICLIPVRK